MLSITADYALRALLLLAREEKGRAIRAGEIADATGAPRNYMSKVLNLIAKAGMISSARGPSGGFALSVPAEDITLGSVVDLFASVPPNPACMLGSGPCDPMHPCRAHDAWKALTNARRSPLNSTSIADLLEGRVAPLALETNRESRHVA